MRMAGDDHDGDERLTAAEVAETLGVRRPTLWGYVARGQFPVPDGEFGPKLKWWWSSTVETWLAGRPGQGARTDRAGPRVGSLFSGYGGLDLAVTAVFGARLAWHVETDPAAATVLAQHHPAVPNHGDVTAVDWTGVGEVDVLTGGFPCQDVSIAGARAGMSPDSRSGLWAHMAQAIAVLKPRTVVIENVPGLLSAAAADRELERDASNVGDRAAEPALRGLGAVLGELAELGFDAQWCCLRADQVGAPHVRNRLVILAFDRSRGPHVAAHPHRTRLALGGQQPARGQREAAERDGGAGVWGQYTPAIERWEHVTGRAAPAPTTTGPRGGTTLNPAFSEWMMGLPTGHVTAVTSLDRRDQLRLLGNGVVPQQAAAALTHLLDQVATEHTDSDR